MLLGCVQPAMMPNINSATARVLDAAGIQTLVADGAGCCGALRTPPERPRRRPGRHAPQHRRLVAAGRGLTSQGKVEAIVMNAVGCGVTVKDYGHALAHDPAYADKARAHQRADARPQRAAARPGAARCRPRCSRRGHGALAFHPPVHAAARPAAARRRRAAPGRAGLRGQHRGQREPPVLRLGRHLQRAAARTVAPAARPQARPPGSRCEPQAIVSANIGCIQHLQTGTATPVRHWVEVLDEALGPERRRRRWRGRWPGHAFSGPPRGAPIGVRGPCPINTRSACRPGGDREWGLRPHARATCQTTSGAFRQARHRRWCRAVVVPAGAGPIRGRLDACMRLGC